MEAAEQDVRAQKVAPKGAARVARVEAKGEARVAGVEQRKPAW
jgi:hypothetical protein